MRAYSLESARRAGEPKSSQPLRASANRRQRPRSPSARRGRCGRFAFWRSCRRVGTSRNVTSAERSKRRASVNRRSAVRQSLSGDPEQEYFADGITDDLTTDLSHLPDSFVIARGTAFTYKGKPVDAKQIGRELGVRYLLEGSVRRSARRSR